MTAEMRPGSQSWKSLSAVFLFRMVPPPANLVSNISFVAKEDCFCRSFRYLGRSLTAILVFTLAIQYHETIDTVKHPRTRFRVQ
jgi:hypothetical protein